MRLFLDTADFTEIETAVGWGVISGVTTNPTLIARAGQDHETQVKRICELVGDVSAETVTEKRDDLIVEGRRIASWHKNVIVKVASVVVPTSKAASTRPQTARPCCFEGEVVWAFIELSIGWPTSSLSWRNA